ncbi:soluble quino protein glucose dehydrogenase [Lophium mytilinum]|uniref:Soluble quino protein glucose dehydrogenase n=1 Tax=Lophium mytilinum TaxID=390894 RepID=A0A6A6QTT6_9PEZI|nr:soluble quino protein glucose dehydrogenase [Lophium mytilinum]
MKYSYSLVASCFYAIASAQSMQTCSTTLSPKNAAPSVAPGWDVKVVATGLTSPRGIIFDTSGHLLVVQRNTGIVSLPLTDNGGSCVTAGKPTVVIKDKTLNHGIELSSDGKTLYASSADIVYAWDYDAANSKNTSKPRQIVTGMSTSDHTTRTLLVSKQVDNLLLVSRGSTSNLDLEAEDINTGRSQIKAFNLTNSTGAYDFNTNGLRLGWGLRNSVGVAEEPLTGGIWSVENSVDEMEREGKNIHTDNPGEEMNFHGYLNGTEYAPQGQNYGYPSCFAAWNVSTIPQNEGIEVGTQFAIGNQNSTLNDTICQKERIPPRLTFQAHQAPLDLKFNANGSEAWVTFHGSWDRAAPVGYKLSLITFANGSPLEPSNSTTAAVDIVANQDNSKCPDACFRPVGLAWDTKGRLFMSSDATGEVYVITRADGGAVNVQPSSTASPTTTGTATGTGQAAASSTKPGAGVRERVQWWVLAACMVMGLLV